MKTMTIIFGYTVRTHGAHTRPLHQGPWKASYAPGWDIGNSWKLALFN